MFRPIKRQFGQTGFTLLETIIALSLFALVIILVSNIYLANQLAYNRNSDMAELNQNARVALDRISRELRQSANLVTSLPATPDEPGNPPASQILFQDGHDTSQITYLKYYLSGSNLRREHKAYYFAAEPSVYVLYNSIDQGGSPPLEISLADQVVGEYFTELSFWGSDGLVNLSLSLNKNQHSFIITTSVFSRNR